MSSTRWTNRYIPLVQEKSSYIIPFHDHKDIEKLRRDIAEKTKGYSKIRLEIGCGAGAHLAEIAAKEAGVFFLGCELRYKRTYLTSVKAGKKGVTNAAVIHGDAFEIINAFESESLDGIYVNFPDPWEKRRWRKNRTMSEHFIPILHEKLRNGGFISYKTDHEGYFDETIGFITKSPLFAVEHLTRDLHKSEWEPQNTPSEFEILFRSKGIHVFYSLLRKLGEPPTTEV